MENLDLWSQEHIQRFTQAVQSSPTGTPFAVFDADNTIWKHDITEGLLAYMSVRGLFDIQRDLPQHLRPIPVRPDDTGFSYYDRLCEVTHSLAYLWVTQIFAGHTLGELRELVTELMAMDGVIHTPMPNGETKAVPVPKIFPAQRQLIHWLESQGVQVWVVSASLEEVVRMVVSDPKYGLSIPPERVIGVNLMLQKPDGQTAVGALERSENSTGLEYYFSPQRMQWTLTDYPYAPLTWYAGKVAGIKEWIHPSQRPLLVAGDSPNDFYMQFYCDVDNHGVRLRIHLHDGHKQQLNAAQQKRMNSNADADPTKGWVEVTPAQLGVPN